MCVSITDNYRILLNYRYINKNNNTKMYFFEIFLFHEVKYCISRVISYQ